jgi:hypothetical protein
MADGEKRNLTILTKTLINYCICILDGSWGAWSFFSTCSVTCGGGTQSHTRLCNNPSPSFGGAACSGSSSENASCNAQPCPTGKISRITHNYIIFLTIMADSEMKNINFQSKKFIVVFVL